MYSPGQNRLLPKIHVSIPFGQLYSMYISGVLRAGINPEIGLSARALDSFTEDQFRTVVDKLYGRGLNIRLHGPFMDLRPGAIDEEIRQVSEARISQAFGLIDLFGAKSIVCHPSFDSRYYVSSKKLWLEKSLRTWGNLLERHASDFMICFENVYESGPDQIRELLDRLGSPRTGFCFDTGHFNAFSRVGWRDWIGSLGPYLKELHLHDNLGATDDHLPVGEGNFPFQELFGMLKQYSLQPAVTVEPHTEANLWRTLDNIEKMGLL